MLGVAVFVALKPRISKNIVAAIVLFGGLAFIAAGVTAAVIGERDFEHHGGTEHPAEGK